MTGAEVRAARLIAAAALAAALLVASDLAPALAQANPFGIPRGAPPPPPPEGIAGWLLAKQAEFYRGLSGMLRAAKADGTAVWGLFGLSFLYGVFHAAGPGHGKAVISSYLLANEETWRRGIALSFASAMLQAFAAVAIVTVAAAILGVSGRVMGEAVRMIEIASYALIALIGARLLWVKGRALAATLMHAFGRTPALAAPALAGAGAGAAASQPHGHHAHGHHAHGHAHHGPAHHGHAHHGHAHGHDHAPGEACGVGCGHAHGPEPQDLAGPGGWRRGLAAIVAVGLRPCSGAILVLVFALAQGLFWAGIVATFIMGLGTAITVAAIAMLAVGAKSVAIRLAGAPAGGGALALRGLEVIGALLVLGFGLALLAGYMASERLAL